MTSAKDCIWVVTRATRRCRSASCSCVERRSLSCWRNTSAAATTISLVCCDRLAICVPWADRLSASLACSSAMLWQAWVCDCRRAALMAMRMLDWRMTRSEEHTSELQSRENLVCRLLLEKKKKNQLHET